MVKLSGLTTDSSDVIISEGNMTVEDLSYFQSDIDVSGNITCNTINNIYINKGNNNIDTNIAVGYNNLNNITDGGNNIVFGTNILNNNTTGYDNVAIGHRSLGLNIDSYRNIAIGQEALYKLETKGDGNYYTEQNLAVGWASFRNLFKGRFNVSLGTNSGLEIREGQKNTFIGAYADIDNCNNFWNNSCAIGYNAKITASNQIVLGNDDITEVKTSGSLNINGKIILSNAVETNLGIGYKALHSNIDGSKNTAFGYNALTANTDGSYNTAVGYKALTDNTTGYNNIALGTFVLNNNTTGYDNVAIGYNALGSNIDSFRNIAIGKKALYNLKTKGDGEYDTQQNLAVGWASLRDLTTGRFNVSLGTSAGLGIIEGEKNTFIGASTDIDISNNSYNNSCAIGYEAKITASNQIVLGNDDVNELKTNANIICKTITSEHLVIPTQTLNDTPDVTTPINGQMVYDTSGNMLYIYNSASDNWYKSQFTLV
jgi:trimeric autotransporter adhesin